MNHFGDFSSFTLYLSNWILEYVFCPLPIFFLLSLFLFSTVVSMFISLLANLVSIYPLFYLLNIHWPFGYAHTSLVFPGASAGKESACSAVTGSILGSGSSPGKGIGYSLHFSWASLMTQMVKNPPAMWSLGWEDPLREGMATHCSILAWRIPMDRGAWRCIVHRVSKSQARLGS